MRLMSIHNALTANILFFTPPGISILRNIISSFLIIHYLICTSIKKTLLITTHIWKILCRYYSKTFFISTRDKAYIAHELLITLAINLFENVTEKSSLRFINVIKSITAFVLSQHDAINHLIQLTTSEYYEYSHPVNVGINAMGLAKELLDPQEHNMTEIFEGFFLHDIGKYVIPNPINS